MAHGRGGFVTRPQGRFKTCPYGHAARRIGHYCPTSQFHMGIMIRQSIPHRKWGVKTCVLTFFPLNNPAHGLRMERHARRSEPSREITALPFARAMRRQRAPENSSPGCPRAHKFALGRGLPFRAEREITLRGRGGRNPLAKFFHPHPDLLPEPRFTGSSRRRRLFTPARGVRSFWIAQWRPAGRPENSFRIHHIVNRPLCKDRRE